MSILDSSLLVAIAFLVVTALLSILVVHFIRMSVWVNEKGLHTRFWFFTETVPFSEITQVHALYRYWANDVNNTKIATDWAVFYWTKSGTPHQLGKQMYGKRFMHPGSSAAKVSDQLSGEDRTLLLQDVRGEDLMRRYAALELETMTIDHLSATPIFQVAHALHEKLPLHQGPDAFPDWSRTESAGPFGGGMSGARLPYAHWSFDGSAGLIPKTATVERFRTVSGDDDD